jgi:hypothetical protein
METKHLELLGSAVRFQACEAHVSNLDLGTKVMRIVASLQAEAERDARDKANGKGI